MLSSAVSVEGFEPLENEPVFEPSRDLQLEPPARRVMLSELGYKNEEIDASPSQMAVALPFRILSDSGVEKLQSVVDRLSTRLDGVKGSRKLRSNVFRSKFIHDVCNSQDLTDFLSDIAGLQLEPCTFRVQQGHLNFAPSDVEREIVRWHYDTVNFSLAVMVSDPEEYEGADYEYFQGTVEEADRILREDGQLPVERTQRVVYRGAGFAMLAQGNRLEHRVTSLDKPGERITLVNCYLAADCSYSDPCTLDHLEAVDPHAMLYPEWVRHKAIRSSRKLQAVAEGLTFTDDYEQLEVQLKQALADAEQALDDVRRAKAGRFSTKSSQYTYGKRA